jgi:predicted ATPase
MLSIPAPPEYPIADMPPDQQKQRTMNTLRTVLFNRAALQPVLFVVEDLHWVDPTTVELLSVLIEEISDAKILALLTCRPDFASPWAESGDVLAIDLGRLQADDAMDLTQTVAGGRSLPKTIINEVVAKTDGVPLFIEELTKMVVESGWLEERADQYVLTGPMPPMAIPSTLHDSLMARLDRLSSVKSLAQLGAVIGREFSYRLVAAVSPWDPMMLQDGLARLVAAEFVYQRGIAPDVTYRFKHALIQDAAYQSLLMSTRQHHHQRIATALAEQFPEVVDSQPEVLARHYAAAGLADQAIPYWEAAAQRALQGFANQEAANHAARALELLDTQPETLNRWKQELHLQLILAAATTPVGGPHAAEPIYTRARELARKVGGTAEVFPALAGLAYAKIVQGHVQQARTLGDEFLELSEPLHDPVISSVGHWITAYAAWWQGDVVDVRRHSRQCLALCSPEQHRAGIAVYNNNPGIVCGYLDAMASWTLGFPSEAVEAMDHTVTHAKGLDHPYSLAVSLLFSAQLCQLRREPQLARVRAEEALAVSSEHGLHALSLWCLLPRGWALVQHGEVDAGIADIREAMDRRRAMGMGAVWPWFLTLFAEACGELGDFEEGIRATDEALEWVQRNDERLYASEAHRVRGELVRGRPATGAAEAEQCFEQALTIARGAGAKSWELRAATSMAAMWLEQGRRSESRNLLAPIYDWFTEGFNTADLIAAKALLEQL